MLRAAYTPYILHFKTPGGTSRGVLHEKETFFIKVWDEADPSRYGIGECALFRGLSADDVPGYEAKLRQVCRDIDRIAPDDLQAWSSIRFGVETALADLRNGGCRIVEPSPFVTEGRPIEINGLVWMGDRETMRRRIEEKLEAGFRCIKLKIGALDFEAELSLLEAIRSRFGPETIELRVDANGAFSPAEAPAKLERLARFGLHSIEQPLRQGQWAELAALCRRTPLPVALDEELIGINNAARKAELLDTVAPQYIVLKPALAGGLSGAQEWIALARERGIGWWITSALESNVGLNAIAQWTGSLGSGLPQGLGTGQLYTDNLPSPLVQHGPVLAYDSRREWDIERLSWIYV